MEEVESIHSHKVCRCSRIVLLIGYWFWDKRMKRGSLETER